MTPRVHIGVNRREQIEQAVARQVPNSRIMADHGITYRQLRALIDGMVHEPAPRRVRGRRGSHGTESGFNTHKRKKEPACDPCGSAHEVAVAAHQTVVAAQKAARDAAPRPAKRPRRVA